MQAMFERKPSDFSPKKFVIKKTIQLSADTFEAVLRAPLKDYDFIKANANLMGCDINNVFHCLLLTGKGRTDGLLVESEGAAYCRYAAYVPEASALRFPILQEQNRCMADAVDYIVNTGTQNTTQGDWRITFDELAEHTGFKYGYDSANNLIDLLCEQAEIAEVVQVDFGIDLFYYPEFCPNCQPEPEEAVPEQTPEPPAPTTTTLRDLLRTRWEDIHLMHKDVEVEPHTIVELDASTLTPAGQEAWADVLSAKVCKIYTGYYGLQLELDGVKPRRLEEFSAMLGGYCSVQDYEKWVTEGADAPSQSPEMKL